MRNTKLRPIENKWQRGYRSQSQFVFWSKMKHNTFSLSLISTGKLETYAKFAFNIRNLVGESNQVNYSWHKLPYF